MPPESFDFPRGGAIQLHFADVGADLHPVGAGIHAQRSTDRAGNSNQAFHAAEVVLSAKGDGAAQVSRGVDVRQIAFQDDVGLGWNELQNHPRQLPVIDQQV